MICVTSGCQPTNQLWYYDLGALPINKTAGTLDFSSYDKARPSAVPLPLRKLVDNFEASYEYVTNDDKQFTFLTNLEAPTYRLLAL
jgi:prolyl oligopeptidase